MGVQYEPKTKTSRRNNNENLSEKNLIQDKSEIYEPNTTESNAHEPIETKNLIAWLFFTSLNKLINFGSRIPFTVNTLFRAPTSLIYGFKLEDFRFMIEQKIQKEGNFGLGDVYFFQNSIGYLVIFYSVIAAICELILPFILKWLITWLLDDQAAKNDGYVYLGWFRGLTITKDYFNTRAHFGSKKLACYARNLLLVKNDN